MIFAQSKEIDKHRLKLITTEKEKVLTINIIRGYACKLAPYRKDCKKYSQSMDIFSPER